MVHLTPMAYDTLPPDIVQNIEYPTRASEYTSIKVKYFLNETSAVREI